MTPTDSPRDGTDGKRVRPIYILSPGWITSKTDGDQHYVGEADLMRLYGVCPEECVSDRMPLHGLHTEAMIVLRPRYDGDYRNPLEAPR